MAFILRHGSKQKKPFIRKIVIGYTGYAITYCDEKQAHSFASRAVAVQVAKSLWPYGNFYPVEVGNDTD